jgi:hypothetical protein
VGALALPHQSQEQLTRVAATVTAVQRLNLPGVVPVADLVGHQGRAWLVAARPVGTYPDRSAVAGRGRDGPV